MTTLTVKVPNISCAHCLHTIKTEVGELSGVKTVEASLETKRVTIGYDDTITQDKIEARLAEIDYPVEKSGA
jgi:copper ion binding protein